MMPHRRAHFGFSHETSTHTVQQMRKPGPNIVQVDVVPYGVTFRGGLKRAEEDPPWLLRVRDEGQWYC